MNVHTMQTFHQTHLLEFLDRCDIFADDSSLCVCGLGKSVKMIYFRIILVEIITKLLPQT